MKRVVIIGTSGSGKTTLAKALANKFGLAHTELDTLYWLPDWQPREEKDFRERTKKFVAQESWVIDGNYSIVRDLVWTRATTIIWLDYPFLTVFFQTVKRSFLRILSKEKVCAGNTESFQRVFFSFESIIWWVVKTHYKNKHRYSQLLKTDFVEGVDIIICRTKEEADDLMTF